MNYKAQRSWNIGDKLLVLSYDGNTASVALKGHNGEVSLSLADANTLAGALAELKALKTKLDEALAAAKAVQP